MLLASDGSFTTETAEPGTSPAGGVSTGTLNTTGQYWAQLMCTSTGGTITGFTEATATVLALSSITVTPASSSVVLPTPGTTQLKAIGNYAGGLQQDLTAAATWSSSNINVATVSAGQVSCKTNGQVTITAKSGAVVGSPVATVTCLGVKSVAVTPTHPPEVAYGGTIQLTAMATYSSGPAQNVTATAAWSSSATSIATVSAGGLVTCQKFQSKNDQSAKISATYGGVAGSTTVTCEQPGGTGDDD
jgi:hypothetical protein